MVLAKICGIKVHEQSGDCWLDSQESRREEVFANAIKFHILICKVINHFVKAKALEDVQ